MESKFSYEVDPTRRRVRVIYRQQPNFREWCTAMEILFRDPSFQPGFGILIDRRAIGRPADTDYIHQVVQFIEDSVVQSGPARWAFLVSDLASFGMARMAEQLASSDRIRAFRDGNEAERWLSAGPCQET